jgi:integrase
MATSTQAGTRVFKPNHGKDPERDEARFRSRHSVSVDLDKKEDNPMVSVRCRTTSDYDAVTITPQQAFPIWQKLPLVEGLLVLLAASTGLRISECLGLQCADVDFGGRRIHVRRTWMQCGVGEP